MDQEDGVLPGGCPGDTARLDQGRLTAAVPGETETDPRQHNSAAASRQPEEVCGVTTPRGRGLSREVPLPPAPPDITVSEPPANPVSPPVGPVPSPGHTRASVSESASGKAP